MKHNPDYIKSLKFVDHVRQRPGMYIGSLDSNGIIFLICESLDTIYQYFSKKEILFHISIGKDHEFKIIVQYVGTNGQAKKLDVDLDITAKSNSLEYFELNFSVFKAFSEKWKFSANNSEFTIESKLINIGFDEEIILEKLMSKVKTMSILYPNSSYVISDLRKEYLQQMFFKNPLGLDTLWKGNEKNFIDILKVFKKYKIEIKIGVWERKKKTTCFINLHKQQKHGSFIAGIKEGLTRAFKIYVKEQVQSDLKFKAKTFLKRVHILAHISGDEFTYIGPFKILGLNEPSIKLEVSNLVEELSLKKLRESDSNTFIKS